MKRLALVAALTAALAGSSACYPRCTYHWVSQWTYDINGHVTGFGHWEADRSRNPAC